MALRNFWYGANCRGRCAIFCAGQSYGKGQLTHQRNLQVQAPIFRLVCARGVLLLTGTFALSHCCVAVIFITGCDTCNTTPTQPPLCALRPRPPSHSCSCSTAPELKCNLLLASQTPCGRSWPLIPQARESPNSHHTTTARGRLASAAMAAAADVSQYECGICCNLLLEPVVGEQGRLSRPQSFIEVLQHPPRTCFVNRSKGSSSLPRAARAKPAPCQRII